jgi:hypothetical protein
MPIPYNSQALMDSSWPVEVNMSIYAIVLIAFYFSVFL